MSKSPLSPKTPKNLFTSTGLRTFFSAVSNLPSLSKASLFSIFLFVGHGISSVTLILLNKNISVAFPHAWTVVFLQNFGTILGALILSLLGIVRPIRLPSYEKGHLWRIVLNSLWLIFVLWASVRSLQFVSVPLYVVARNTVPFQTALLDRLVLKKMLRRETVIGLLMTFVGTLIYTSADMSLDSEGLAYAVLNTVLVASICVYENHVMGLVKQDLTAIELNFYRVLFSTPFLLPFLLHEWMVDFDLNLLDLQSLLTGEFFTKTIYPRFEPVVFQIFLSAVGAFSIGTFLLSLQGITSATTIQLANIGYKFLTTAVSRFTHPTEVAALGWLGYAICSAGMIQYSLAPVVAESAKFNKRSGGSSSTTKYSQAVAAAAAKGTTSNAISPRSSISIMRSPGRAKRLSSRERSDRSTERGSKMKARNKSPKVPTNKTAKTTTQSPSSRGRSAEKSKSKKM